jgi:hypothetical protein
MTNPVKVAAPTVKDTWYRWWGRFTNTSITCSFRYEIAVSLISSSSSEEELSHLSLFLTLLFLYLPPFLESPDTEYFTERRISLSTFLAHLLGSSLFLFQRKKVQQMGAPEKAHYPKD